MALRAKVAVSKFFKGITVSPDCCEPDVALLPFICELQLLLALVHGAHQF
jgi:hypothetical protein